MAAPTQAQIRAIAGDLAYETRAFVGGEFVAALSGAITPVFNPATGALLAEVAECARADVDRAVTAARTAFDDGRWSTATPKHRKRVLLKFADLIDARREALAVMESLHAGKPVADTLAADLPDLVEGLRWHAETADKLHDVVLSTADDVRATATREPVGVVGAVLAWNFPLVLAGLKIGPALAAGNSIVLKPSEQTPLTLLAIARLAAEAGIPPGVLNVVPGLGETAGQAIGRHHEVDCVSFTGSTEIGRQFLRYSAESNLKRVVLECGGKSPAIVLADAHDLEYVAHQVALGALFCQGENCSAGSRAIVHRAVQAQFEVALKAAFAQWTVGDPLDPATRIGALIDAGHMRRVLGHIDRGERDGARLILGGERLHADSGGSFVSPTIFTDVTPQMAIARDEIFGPVLALLGVDDTEQAVRIANDTNYGLAASLYTSDLDTAHRVARRIRAGTVSVNCYSEGDTGAPFGGFKASGFGGRDKSLLAHDQYTEVKTTWIQLR